MEERKPNLLIVDDNIFFIDRVISLLEESCRLAKIGAAHDYNEAITYLENETPEIILLDINLPGKNGIEILREIKKAGKKYLMVVISNHDNEYYREQCKKLGADHFLDKSGDFGMLVTIINNYSLRSNLL
jgi:DNA-binding NarL/FixJ family response regulator